MDHPNIESGHTGNALQAGISFDMLQAIYQYSPDGILVVDHEGTIVSVNRRCGELLGYGQNELIGESVESLVPPQFENHSDLRAAFHQSPSSKPMSRRPILEAMHKSGALIPVDISLSPLPPINGYHGLVEAAIRDAQPKEEVQHSVMLQSIAMDAAANGILITDSRGVIQWVNPAVCKMTGYSSEELIGNHSRLLKSGEHDEDFYRHLWQTVMQGETWFGDIVNKRKDGSLYFEEQHIAPVLDAQGNASHFIAIKQDVTARKQAETRLQRANRELKKQLKQIEKLQDELRRQAMRDPLTNLFNRRYLDDMLARELTRAKRSGLSLGTMTIDIDHFKKVNDGAGHATGDMVLRILAESITVHVRSCDIACRLGGDEFLVVLPGISLAAASQRASMIQATFSKLQHEKRDLIQGVHATISIGVSQLSAKDSIESLIQRGDSALYRAKDEGRNRVVTQAP